MLSDVVSELTTKKKYSLTVAIINTEDNEKMDAKITIIQEEGYVSSSTTHVKLAFSETPKEYVTSLPHL